jgi:general secretion pathway protein J
MIKPGLNIRWSGFTLIEMMVAISLSSLVAMGAYQTFDSSVAASQSAQAQADQLNQLDRVWRLLESDLKQSLARQNVSVDAFSEQSPALYGVAINTGHFEEGANNDTGLEPLSVDNPQGQPWFLRFTRTAWSNPLEQVRSDLRGVAYHVDEGRLWRLHWPVLNSDELELNFSGLNFDSRSEEFAEDLQPSPLGMRQQLLIEGIQGLALRYLPADATNTSDATWVNAWPQTSNTEASVNDSLPRAIEVSLFVEDFGGSTRLFLLNESS